MSILEKLLIDALCFFAGAGIVVLIYYISTLSHKKLQPVNEPEKQAYAPIQLDQYTTERYLNCLKDMIYVYINSSMNSKYGELYNKNMIMVTDVSNDTIYEIYEDAVKNINLKMGKNMRDYLSYAFGEEWLIDYISKTTMDSVTIEIQNRITTDSVEE